MQRGRRTGCQICGTVKKQFHNRECGVCAEFESGRGWTLKNGPERGIYATARLRRCFLNRREGSLISLPSEFFRNQEGLDKFIKGDLGVAFK